MKDHPLSRKPRFNYTLTRRWKHSNAKPLVSTVTIIGKGAAKTFEKVWTKEGTEFTLNFQD